MKQINNTKGMTLVEVLVVLLMMSILLVVVGSLILNSFKYFNQTSDQDLNKRSLDSISEFVRGELLYSNDVRVQDTQPEGENWQVFHVKGGKLFHNNEQLYSDTFYNHKELEIKVRGFDTYRLDLHYSLSEPGESKVYSTKDTLELLNLKIVSQADKEFNPFSNISSITTVNETNRIYYQRGVKPDIDEPKPDDPTKGNGTVADQIDCKTTMNDKKEFQDGKYYNLGDFVSIVNKESGEIEYYRCLFSDTYWHEDNVTSILTLRWKKISAFHSVTSGYLKGDIVIDKETGLYYRCKKSTINLGTEIKVSGGYNSKEFWEEIPKPTESNKLCGIPGLIAEDKGTVADKDDDLDLSKIEEYSGGHGNTGFVKHNGYIWKRLDTGQGNTPPGEKDGKGNYIWQKIQAEWDSTSAYTSKDYSQGEYQDVIIYEGAYYRVKMIDKGGMIQDGRPPALKDANGKWIANNGWEKVMRVPASNTAGFLWQAVY